MKLWNPLYKVHKDESGVVSCEMISYRIDFDSLLDKFSKLDIIEIVFLNIYYIICIMKNRIYY